MKTSLLLGTLFLLITAPVLADQRQGENWRWDVQAGLLHQLDADLDDGGESGVDRVFAQLGASTAIGGDWRLGLTLGLGRSDYDFSGGPGLAAANPWDKIDELRLGVSTRYRVDDAWTLFAIPSLRFNAESDASLGDGMTVGLLGGASYRISDKLSLGPGFGVFSEIEDSASLFPVLLIDWQITDTLSLETGRGYAASRGPGLQLNWRHSPQWRFALGGRYEKQRFRLNDQGPAPDGVGEQQAFPLYALAEYSVGREAQLTLIGGAELNGELTLEDEDGRQLENTDMDTAPFFGLNLRIGF